MPSTICRWSNAGRLLRPRSGGRRGSSKRHSASLRSPRPDQLINLLGVAAVLCPQRLDFDQPPFVLGDDPLAALARDVEQRTLELARDPLQVVRPVLHARGIIGSER
jgi:hypothetical protein